MKENNGRDHLEICEFTEFEFVKYSKIALKHPVILLININYDNLW